MAEEKKGMPRASDVKKIKDELLQRKQDLEKELVDLDQEKFSDGQVQDPGDQALSSTMESLQSSLLNSRIEEYNRIVKALEMIDEDTYGICVDCGLPISEKRLKSFPNATRCISCQEAFEENGPGL